MSKTKLLNLTNNKISPFMQPNGAKYYPIAIVAPADVMDEIITFLNKSPYVEQPEVCQIPRGLNGYLPYDWTAFHTGGIADRLLWVCISERVYGDPGFRAVIMEYLI